MSQFMIMPRCPEGDQGGTSPCLFMGPKTVDVFRSTPNFPSPTILPAQHHHSILSTNDKGLGLFATHDLKVTDLILAERPLLLVPSRVQDNLNGESGSKYCGGCPEEWEAIILFVSGGMCPKQQAAFAKLENDLPGGYGPITGVAASNGFGS